MNSTIHPAASSPAAGGAQAAQAERSPKLWKRFLAFMVPMLASNVLQSLSGTVNNIYLGPLLSKTDYDVESSEGVVYW
jgi:Na+-driven multidrug efflux pump